jgi:hypothetical protein
LILEKRTALEIVLLKEKILMEFHLRLRRLAILRMEVDWLFFSFGDFALDLMLALWFCIIVM